MAFDPVALDVPNFSDEELAELAGFFERMTANLRSTYSDDGGSVE